MDAGQKPIQISTFNPITDQDGSIILQAEIPQLTVAGYYRVRVQLSDSLELACSGSYFKVIAQPDVFTQVVLHDFTHAFSSTKVKLLRDEDRPQLSLYFADAYGNEQDQTNFVKNL